MADDDEIARLIERLRAREAVAVPTTTFGRLRRTAGSAARAASAAARSRVFGGELIDDETLERVITSLGDLKGIAMKVGQIVSYVDAPIPEKVKRRLSVLQAQSPPTPFADIESVIRADLGGRANALLSTMDRAAVSSASIGQVHRATLPTGERVAVKVRHPGIEDALRADFRGARVGKSMVKLLVPGADVSELIDEAEETILGECDYEREARNQARFAALYVNDADIVVPRVFSEYSSRRVLVTAWHDGAPFESFLNEARVTAVARAGRTLFRFYVGTFYERGFFNADPHPGNMLFHDDGRVVFLDYGCVRDFRREVIVAMARLSEAVRANDEQGILAAFAALGARFEGKRAQEERTAALHLARAFFSPLLEPGVRKIEVGFANALGAILEHKRALMRLHLPGELLFLVRIRFGAYSVLSRMGAALDWRELEATAAHAALL